MSRRLLALCSGLSAGYVVGWLAGSNVLRLAEVHRLARPGVPVRPPEPRSGVPEKPLRWVDLFGIDPDYTDGLPVDVWLDRNRRDADPIPTQRLYPLEEVAAEFGVDMEDDCPVTLGPLRCPFTGPHSNHAFQSDTWAPDGKDDTDEGIE